MVVLRIGDLVSSFNSIFLSVCFVLELLGVDVVKRKLSLCDLVLRWWWFWSFFGVWGSASLFVMCCDSKPYPGEEPPKKGGIRLEFLPPTSVRCSCDRSQVVVSSLSRISFNSWVGVLFLIIVLGGFVACCNFRAWRGRDHATLFFLT